MASAPHLSLRREALLAFAALALILLAACGGRPGVRETASPTATALRIPAQLPEKAPQSNLRLSYIQGPRLLFGEEGDPQAVELTFQLMGDLNGDFEASFADINFLVQSFGLSLDQGIPQTADLNRNGEIDFGDVSLFVQVFGTALSGFSLYQDFSLFPLLWVDTLPLESDPDRNLLLDFTPEGFPRLRFVPPRGFADRLRLVPLDGQGREVPDQGSPVLDLGESVPFVPPPVARLKASRTKLFVATQSPPQTVVFDASESFDPKGGPLEFAFDPEGDGTFTPFSPNPILTHTFLTPGAHLARVKVRDSLGATAEATLLVQIKRFTQFPGRGSSAQMRDVALVGGRFISVGYTKPDRPGDLGLPGYSLTKNTLPLEESDWYSGNTMFSEDNGFSTDIGDYIQVAEVGGKPAVSFFDRTRGALAYARAKDPFPQVDTLGRVSSDSFLPMVVDDGGGPEIQVGLSTRLITLADGTPAIAYYDNTNGDLKFAMSSRVEPLSSDDWTFYTVDTGGTHDVGLANDLFLVQGRPAIVYYDATAGDVKFAYALSERPQSPDEWVVTTVYTTGLAGRQVAGVEVEGVPAIAFCDATFDAIRFAYATTPQPMGLEDWVLSTIFSDPPDAFPDEVYCQWALDHDPIFGEPNFDVYGLALVLLQGTPAVIHQRIFAWARVALPDSPSDWQVHLGGGPDARAAVVVGDEIWSLGLVSVIPQ